mmetsp:Transcript_13559/g.39050  ORF Transcript_13559/g.39050 Transcript_13559/m.39050 type:complete len:201 (-) Transcript_13559:1087-1689(-)
MSLARSQASGVPYKYTMRFSGEDAGSSLLISILTPLSLEMELMVSPPFPINIPIKSWRTSIDCCPGLLMLLDTRRSLTSSIDNFDTEAWSSAWRSFARLNVSSTIFLANSTHSGGPVMWTKRSSGFSALASFEMSIRAPLSFLRSLIVSPFLPMRMPTNSWEILITEALGFVLPCNSLALFNVSSIMALAFSTHIFVPLM